MAEPAKLDTRSVWTNPVHFIAFGFGSGLLPYIPGTWGTAAAIPVYCLFNLFPTSVYLLLTVAFVLLSIRVSDLASKDFGIHDYSGMNIDEFAGYLVTMTLAPSGWTWILYGFFVFRFFDILKPFPIRWIDLNVHGGWGMVFDDLLAGVYSWIVLQLTAYILGASLLVG